MTLDDGDNDNDDDDNDNDNDSEWLWFQIKIKVYIILAHYSKQLLFRERLRLTREVESADFN